MIKSSGLGFSYCRKSTRVKDKSVEDSVGYQHQAIDQYGKQNGIKIVKQFSDVGYLGKTLECPELKEMVEYLRSTETKIDYLLDRYVW